MREVPGQLHQGIPLQPPDSVVDPHGPHRLVSVGILLLEAHVENLRGLTIPETGDLAAYPLHLSTHLVKPPSLPELAPGGLSEFVAQDLAGGDLSDVEPLALGR